MFPEFLLDKAKIVLNDCMYDRKRCGEVSWPATAAVFSEICQSCSHAVWGWAGLKIIQQGR